MFGFVTFFHPETVKRILARGNPHYISDSRVLVKPYKEKGKVPDKRQYLQQLEKGNFSLCSRPSRLDSREPYDPRVGAKKFYNAPEMMLRREFEDQADLQQAIELQRRSIKKEVSIVNGGNTAAAAAAPVTLNAAQQEEEVNSACVQKGGVGNPRGIEHALPDSPFASPEKSTESHHSEFPASVEANGNLNLCAMSSSENDQLLLITSTRGMASI
ncbi:Nucleic acid binding protein, putative isoform 2 [Hibiscus syriacus]|uniref:Nucleic acid binding protein, putative isoform 2 n=1 Tax=Hibiscus syriacus TaxID=106335 RepID=A0A6A3BAG8_HIBSY|nr:Nucleic acid binding protein, putative isoform 2 [Hibiscus syriacus]